MWLSAMLLSAALAVAPASAATVPTLPATPQFRHYDINQGLPSSNVYTLVQDGNGVIWMGTRAGLARFDGTDFRVYHHVPGDTSSLAGDDVSTVLADSHGRLWAGGEGSGVNLLDPLSGTFTHYRHDDRDPASLASNDILAMAEDTDGTLWVGMYGAGLDHMTSAGHFEHLEHDPDDPDSLSSDTILALACLDDGRLLIGTLLGLDIRDKHGRMHHARFDGLETPPRVWRIDHDGGEVRLNTTAGLFALGKDGVARRVASDILPVHDIMTSVRDRLGALWVGTSAGLYLVEPDGRGSYFPSEPLMPGGQPGDRIWQLMLDKEGGLWIATQNAGVAYLSPNWRDFSHFSHNPGNPESLSANRIMALTADARGKLWVGGPDGQLDELDPDTGKVIHHAEDVGLAPNAIISLASFGHGNLWIGHHKGLALFDGSRTRRVADKRLSEGVRWLVADRHGTAYASPPGRGVYRVIPDTLEATPLAQAFDNHADRETSDLLLHDGILWRTSRAGLSRLAPDGLHFEPVKGVPPGPIYDLRIVRHNLWLARPNALEHYRIDDDATATLVKRIDASHGWPGPEVNTMTVDSLGRVWLFATVGLWRYDPANGTFHDFTKADGLPTLEFTSQQQVHTPDGAVYVGSLRGVVGFHPDSMHDHPQAPELQVTSALVQRDGSDLRLPLSGHKLDLHWNDRDLRVTARATSYIDPSRNRYRFRLQGLDTDWVDTGTHGVREFAGLGTGTYQLDVKAAGPSGVWNQIATPLSIHVEAPPWARPWAWFLYALAGLLLVWGVVTIWRRRLEQQHQIRLVEQKRRMAESANDAKTRFLATLSHEIRTPMTGLLGMTELLLNGHLDRHERQCARSIQRSGQLMLKLVNDSLDMARIEAGRFELEIAPMDPRALLEDMRLLQSQQARGKGLTWQVAADASVPARLAGDRCRIQQILLNLTNNALKFTREGGVSVHADYADGQLHLQISDTGPGISEIDHERLFRRFEQADSAQRKDGTGLGLAICHELIQLMHGRITLASTPGKGSRFDIFLPLPETAAPVVAPAPDTLSREPDTGLRLLLVEDDTTVAAAISGLLEHAGHQVTHAAQGLAALGTLEHGHVDAVLMDMNLPGMDGCQLTRLIRDREPPGEHLPIVAITARSGTNEEQQARDAGMDAFLRKPVSQDELIRTLLSLTGTA